MIKNIEYYRVDKIIEFLEYEALTFNVERKEYTLSDDISIAYKAFEQDIDLNIMGGDELNLLENRLNYLNVKRDKSMDYYLICMRQNVNKIAKIVDFKDSLTKEHEQELSLEYYKITRDEQIATKNYELWLNNPHLLPDHDYKHLADRLVVKTLAESRCRQFELDLKQEIKTDDFKAISLVLNLMPFKF